MYQEITSSEYRNHYGYDDDGHKTGNIENFSESEFNRIKELLKDYKVKLEYYPDGKKQCINIFKNGPFLFQRKPSRRLLNEKICNIDKLSDDWYMVAHFTSPDRSDSGTKLYKCDQFDGLLRFLSDSLLSKEMKHIKTFEAIRKPPIKNYQSVSEETLNKIQTELEDFLLYELDTYELSDQDGKSLKELPSYVPSRPRYVFNIRFKTSFTKSAESLSKRLNAWDNDYNFTLKAIECQSSSYWSEEREQSFTDIKITFDL